MKFHLPTSLRTTALPRMSGQQRPSRDWLILLFFSLIVFVASVSWNVWTFIRITNGEVVGNGAATVTAPDVSTVERAREVFGARATEAQRYRTEYRFVDPGK